MFKNFLIIFLLTIGINNNAFAVEIWNSENGISRLNSSQYKNDFYQLANFYQAQNNPIHCSSATGLILKNALFYENIPSQANSEITKPNGEIIPFKLYASQENFFNEKTDKIKSRDIIFFKEKTLIKKSDGSIYQDYDPGLNLKDFSKILKAHKINSKIYYQKEVNVSAIDNFRNVVKKILKDEDNFYIDKSDSIAATLLNNLGFLQKGTIGIAFITLIGAAIGLMNIMLVAVNERTKEIGLAKALGATAKAIRAQFLIESIVISLMGSIAGISSGVLFGNLVAVLLHTGLVIPWAWVIAGILVCFLVGLLAGLYPAYKASKLDPIVALRYE